MLTIPRIGVLMLLLLACVSRLFASPADIVTRAYNVDKKLVYSGKLLNAVNVNGRTVQAFVSVHRSKSNLRMEYTSGPMRGTVVIENENAVYTLRKSERTAYLAYPAPADSKVSLLLKNYKPLLLGTQKVAGRPADIINLQPKIAGNPKVKLWIDRSTGLILRSERYLHSGKLATRSTFESIDFTPNIPNSIFVLPKQWKKINVQCENCPVSVENVRKTVGFTPVLPSYVPKGYVLEGYFLRQMGCGNHVAVVKYTNGLNSITIFQRTCGMGKGMQRGRGQKGYGMNRCITKSEPFGNIAQTRIKDINITVSGDISKTQIEKIANKF